MVTIQPIHHDGRLVALVAGGHALIDRELAGEDLALVQAKCLYALEIEGRTFPGPYTDSAAERFARGVLDSVAITLRRRPPVIRLPARCARRVKS